MPNYRFLINFVAVGRRFWWRFSGNEQRDKEQKAVATFSPAVCCLSKVPHQRVSALNQTFPGQNLSEIFKSKTFKID